MTFPRFIFKGLFKKKLRLTLTLTGVAVGISICVIMLGLSNSIRSAFRKAYLDRDIDVVVFEKDQFDIMASRISDSMVKKMEEFPEVDCATGVLMEFFKYKTDYLPVYGWSLDSPQFPHLKITAGRMPVEGRNEIMIGDVFANYSGENIGRTLNVRGVDFEIVGVYKSRSSFEKSAIIMLLKKLQELSENGKDKLVGINITLKDKNRNQRDIDILVKKINHKYENLTAQQVDLFVEEKTKQIIMGEKVAWMVAAISMIAVVLGLTNTMITNVYEQRKLLGILIVVGWKKSDVLKLFFTESMIIVFTGSAIGLFLGMCGMNYIFDLMNISVFVPSLNDRLFIEVALLSVFTGIIATIAPLSVIINLNPVEVIKGD